MKKNTVALAVAAAMTASLLVGCGGTAADSTSTAESTATSTDAASAATTTAGGDETLTVWAWDPNFNIYALKQAEAIYQKDHPNFKLQWRLQHSAGCLPDAGLLFPQVHR